MKTVILGLKVSHRGSVIPAQSWPSPFSVKGVSPPFAASPVLPHQLIGVCSPEFVTVVVLDLPLLRLRALKAVPPAGGTA